MSRCKLEPWTPRWIAIDWGFGASQRGVLVLDAPVTAWWWSHRGLVPEPFVATHARGGNRGTKRVDRLGQWSAYGTRLSLPMRLRNAARLTLPSPKQLSDGLAAAGLPREPS